MELEIKDIIGYGASMVAVIGSYFKLSHKHDELEKEIIEIKNDMKAISSTHITITNGMVRLTDTIDAFKQEAYKQWERTDSTLEKTDAGLQKIFDKFDILNENIAEFYKENAHVFTRSKDAKSL